ncbi:MAG TPA: MarR family transcriptional regulator [Devosiaceae bacterium]|jgi:MarR family transcriptional regulator for hemolysin
MIENYSFVQVVAHVSRCLQTAFDAELKGLGLTAARGKVLFKLALAQTEVSQTEMTDFLRVENPTAVRILDGLESLGYIKRVPADHDRRVKMIALTDAGRPLADRVVLVARKLSSAVVEGLTPEDIAAAGKVLNKITANVAAAGVGRGTASEGDDEASA